MRCEYDDREITGEPYKVRMHKQSQLASSIAPAGSGDTPEIGYRYFHDETCYDLFIKDNDEYEAVDLPGQQTA
jgi:hypothetical protein